MHEDGTLCLTCVYEDLVDEVPKLGKYVVETTSETWKPIQKTHTLVVQRFLKFGISIVHINMYSCVKVGIQIQTRKTQTKMMNFRCMCTKRQIQILPSSAHAPNLSFLYDFLKNEFASQLTYLYVLDAKFEIFFEQLKYSFWIGLYVST